MITGERLDIVSLSKAVACVTLHTIGVPDGEGVVEHTNSNSGRNLLFSCKIYAIFGHTSDTCSKFAEKVVTIVV